MISNSPTRLLLAALFVFTERKNNPEESFRQWRELKCIPLLTSHPLWKMNSCQDVSAAPGLSAVCLVFLGGGLFLMGSFEVAREVLPSAGHSESSRV